MARTGGRPRSCVTLAGCSPSDAAVARPAAAESTAGARLRSVVPPLRPPSASRRGRRRPVRPARRRPGARSSSWTRDTTVATRRIRRSSNAPVPDGAGGTQALQHDRHRDRRRAPRARLHLGRRPAGRGDRLSAAGVTVRAHARGRRRRGPPASTCAVSWPGRSVAAALRGHPTASTARAPAGAAVLVDHAVGSVSAMARTSPVAMRGSRGSCCSAVPTRASSRATTLCPPTSRRPGSSSRGPAR